MNRMLNNKSLIFSCSLCFLFRHSEWLVVMENECRLKTGSMILASRAVSDERTKVYNGNLQKNAK